jgi:hypothetical protein
MLDCSYRDACPHGVPFRFPDWCVECESDDEAPPLDALDRSKAT